MPLKIITTPYYSLCQGALADGCKQCVKGEKLVLFVTGICPADCFFCPLSPEKKMKDVVFANERELVGTQDEQIAQMIEEARASGAKGAGVTGGDPLARLDRTCAMVAALKREFGKEFHIHLYTPLILVNETTLRRLYDVGLDEIRFHPSLSSEKFWPRMRLARRHPWRIGVEVPVLPDKVAESERLIDYAAKERILSFLNLNELEISELTLDTFARRGYEIVRRESYAIKGSREAAKVLMRYAQQYSLPAHFCTTKLKDRVQMGNRVIRRAKSEARPFDIVDKEGLLTRGAVYLSYRPEFSYTKKLRSTSEHERERELASLQEILAWLREQGMPDDAGSIDRERMRIVMGAEALREISSALKRRFPDTTLAVVKEYPTSDAFLVETTMLEPRERRAQEIENKRAQKRERKKERKISIRGS
jgi:hypothetical protein